MKIVFKSDDFAELNFVREYAEKFTLDGAGRVRETEHDVEIELSLDFLHQLTLQLSQNNAFEKNKKALKQADIDKLNDVKALLLKNINNPYSIEELSKIAGINRTKLQEGFKELFGTTIFGYITETRLDEARQKIQNGGKETTIADIATMSGYKNPQHFTAAFKRKFGYLPKEIKR